MQAMQDAKLPLVRDIQHRLRHLPDCGEAIPRDRPSAAKVERALRTEAAELDVRHDDRAAGDDSHPGSVTERSSGVLCRGGDEDVGEIRQFARSRGLGSTRAILTL